MNTVPISEARTKLPKLVDDAATLTKTTYITVKGKVKAALVNAEELKRMEDTLELFSDKEALEAIKQGEEDIKKGRLIDWEDIKEEFNL